ncbi:MAG TPA: hypothetical protein VFK70_17185 [Vicinamibacteria bacterium]|nr:hypothetical protein [Vicinamibacteria bacterium]
MHTPWTAVDGLIRELGAIRSIAPQFSVYDHSRTALDHAMREAAEAIDLTIDAPESLERLAAARDALGVCEEMIIVLDVRISRRLRVRHRGDALRTRALHLLDSARDVASDRVD